jgi:hypothetical protein
MKTLTTILVLLVRIEAPIIITLGLLFWTGNADALIPVHMLLGIVLVLALWTLCVVAAVAGVNLGLVAVAALWGVVVPLLGIMQDRLLPGPAHWVIQVLHLLVGITAIALANVLGLRIRRRLTIPHPAQTRSGALAPSVER